MTKATDLKTIFPVILNAKMEMPDSQRYPLNFYLINLDDFVIFLSFKSVQFYKLNSICFPVVERNKQVQLSF